MNKQPEIDELIVQNNMLRLRCQDLEFNLANKQRIISQLNNGLCDRLCRKISILLDLALDPDPYGVHGLSLQHRLQTMGWPL